MENNQYKSCRDFGSVSVVQNMEGQFAVISSGGEEIVPFGKYAWIDGFDSGLARVRTPGERYKDPSVVAIFDDNFKPITGEALDAYYEDLKANHPDRLSRWGIINMEGEEVVATEFDSVWNFFGKNRKGTTVENDGTRLYVEFSELPGSSYYDEGYYDGYDDDDDHYGCRYGEYEGTYAQDVMGYSDDVINDAFDGEPDAYWNID